MITADHVALFRDVTERAARFVLVTHVNPDGDAVGSQVGLGRLLAWMGKTCRVVNQDETPRTLRFIDTSGPAAEAYDPERHDEVLDRADVIIVVDNAAPDRLGRLERPVLDRAAKALCVDHHPTRGTPWRWNIIDDQASATAVLVHEIGRALGWTIDPVAAAALHAGLATDTGYFRFNSTRASAHVVAADLLRCGADPTRCYAEVYERNPPEFTRLLGHALVSLRLHAGGAVASVRITRAMIEACAAFRVDTSEITTPLLATDGVRIAVLFREMDGGRVKVSLRSKGEIDVHALASEFGGGGHRNASGIVMTAGLDEATQRVLARAVELAGAERR